MIDAVYHEAEDYVFKMVYLIYNHDKFELKICGLSKAEKESVVAVAKIICFDNSVDEEVLEIRALLEFVVCK